MSEVFTPDHIGAIIRKSPNFDMRKEGAKPQFLILHYTGMESAKAAEDRLCDAEAKVSAHYVLREDGTIVQMVLEKDRAWHAGESAWQGMTDINSHSIGIEIVNAGPLDDFPDYPDQQIESLIPLCLDICSRHQIAPRHVLAHSDIAPHRKEDPGEKFPWQKLYAKGVGHWVEPSPISGGRFMTLGENGRPVEAYQAMLALYGYDLPLTGSFDERTEIVTRAFQRHFRPQKVDGVADRSTIETLHRLLGTLKTLA